VQYTTTETGTNVAFCTLGTGPPLVIVPSGPWDTISNAGQIPAWQAWLEGLANGRKVVRYDPEGTGLSDKARAEFSVEAHVRALEAVTARLGQTPAALLAGQHAGPVAITFAARHPEQVSHLILWCSYARGAEYFDAPHSQAIHGLLHQDLDLFVETMTHAHVGWSEGDLAHQMAGILRESGVDEIIPVFDAAARAADVVSLLPQVRTPTLVLHRRQLRHPDLDLTRRLAAGIPNARLVVLEGTSSTPFVGDGDAVLHAIREFLEPVEQQARPGVRRRPAQRLIDPLTDREIEVLRLVAQGLSNAEISRVLIIAPGTTKTHTANILRKLDVNNRTRAVARARELDLLDPS
jgi:DNA-binding CsgD family transcriptional regulator/pimeloyl-ACP methyl ester carboxylesterase